MKVFKIAILLAACLWPLTGAAADFERLNDYVGFRLPIDLRRAHFTSDYQISQSLGTRLVRVGPDGSVVAGLADRWTPDPNGQWVHFHIDARAKWSNGTPITASDVVASFAALKRDFKPSQASLLSEYSKIEVIDPTSFRLILKTGVPPATLLMQLTDPQYGLVKVIKNKISNQVTSGPYSLKSANKNEVVLSANPNWIFYSNQSPKEVHLRRDYDHLAPTTLLEDQWPTMIYLGDGVTKEDLNKIPTNFPIWRLNHDRLVEFHNAGRSSLTQTRALIGFIRANANFKKFAAILDDGVMATQLFAKGLALHSEREPLPSAITNREFKKIWGTRAVRIAYFKYGIPIKIAAAAEKMLREILPVPVEFIGLNGSTVPRAEESGKYDLFFGTLGTDPENLEGKMAFLFNTAPILIPSGQSAKENFKTRLNRTHGSKQDPVQEYRDILVDAVEGNYFLPVAHYSIMVVGRKGLDFSGWTRFGEFLPYHAVRMRP